MKARQSSPVKSVFAAVLVLISFAFQVFGVKPSFADEKETLAPRAPWTTSRLRGSPQPPEPYRIESAFPAVRFDHPTSIEEIPGANRLLVTEMGGKIFTLAKSADVKQADMLVDLVKLLPNDVAGQSVSLFHATLHPDFKKNRQMFVCLVHPAGGRHTRLSRFALTKDNPPQVVPNSEQVIITWPSGGHNAGCLEFGKDGYLYISTGDGAGPNPPDGLTTGQDVSDLLGAILRIDVDHQSDEKAYTVPADNPFVGMQDARPEIWAYGLRNPWKFGVDHETGNIFAADNGWESWEMIHRIVRGGNCGWPIMEGRVALRTEVKPGPTPIIPPVKDHPHTEANSVIGGPVYRGSKLPGLQGSFVYGDYITGTIWALQTDEKQGYQHTTLVDTDQRIVAFAEGSKGELYVLDYDFTGQIYEILPSGLKDTSAQFPRRLSETGLFASLENLQPVAGVVPYHVRVDQWNDGAQAKRWVAIPGDGKIRLSANGDEPAEYPAGTVFVKHLELPQGKNAAAIRLETQILLYENGRWHPYSYLWDDNGLEAHLVDSIGANRALRVADASADEGFVERTWHVNAVNECKLCHNAGSHFVLGFVPNQLNRPLSDDKDSTNLLAALAARQIVASVPKIPADDPLRLVDPLDISQKLDDRARSYLHVNCSMCHHPGGNAIVSFYLRRDLPFAKLNTNKGTGIGTFGMNNAKIIVPGDPYRSVLMYRMSKLGYARMPYIGSQVVDSKGIALIEQWIRSLSSETTGESSPVITAGSPASKDLQTLAKKETKQRADRDQAIRDLLTTTEGTLALIGRIHGGAMDRADIQAATEISRELSNSNIRGLLETFVPESQRRATLGQNIDPEMILKLTGDAARGKLIFFSDNARCRSCHDITDRSLSLGPTLSESVKKYPQQSELLQHILKPSLKIEDEFASFVVSTKDGLSLNGLVVDKNDNEIILKTAEKKLIKIAREDIEEMQKGEESLMPDFILSDLTAQEAADLLTYLRSLNEGNSSQ